MKDREQSKNQILSNTAGSRLITLERLLIDTPRTD